MGDNIKENIAKASVKVIQNSKIEITEAIEKNISNKAWTSLDDRIAAAAAMFSVGGACYFGVWLFLLMNFAEMRSDQIFFQEVLSWRLPTIITLVSTLMSFLVPNIMYRVLDKIVTLIINFLVYL